MALQPWYKVIIPREDLRDGKPLDASEFFKFQTSFYSDPADARCSRPWA
jgi:predicted ATP-dependent Lon-type protease